MGISYVTIFKKKVIFGNSVTTIGYSSFSSCPLLSSFTFPNNITTIGQSSFFNCSSLTSLTIPDSVTSIGSSAFEKCTSLTSVTIPVNVKSIGSEIFSDCSLLTQIVVDHNNQYFSNDEYGVLYNKQQTTLYQYPIGNKRQTYTIPDGVTTIDECSFCYCSSLKIVTIPDSLTRIYFTSFSYCLSIIHFIVNPNNQYFSNDEYGVLYNKKQTKLHQYPIGNERKTYVIPNNVTTIERNSFSHCSSLTNVIIGNNVTSIDWTVFSHCSSLTTVTIGNSVTSIGRGAFEYCTSLTTISIPEIVTSIEQSAFYFCTSLTTVTIKSKSLRYFEEFVFWGCNNLKTLYYYGSSEPTYNSDINCSGDTCGVSSAVSCSPFTCSCSLETVYVPKNYPSATTFCGKEVTFKREL